MEQTGRPTTSAAPGGGGSGGAVAALRYVAAPSRRAGIAELLRRRGHVSVSDLSAALGVSEMTVRRDLRQLAADGDAVLVHGGASLPADARTAPVFGARAHEHAAEKRRIGAAAAALIAPAQVVGLDAGTTVLEVALALPRSYSGQIVTHSLPVLNSLLGRTEVRVLAIGGELAQDSQAMLGAHAARLTSDLRLDTLVLAASALDVRGVFVRSEAELGIKLALLEAARDVVLVCDRSKEDAPGSLRVCSLDRVDVVVTDAPFSDALTDRLTAEGVRITLA